MENNSGLLDLLRDRGILDIKAIGRDFTLSSGDKEVTLSMRELHDLFSELKSLAEDCAPTIVEEYFGLANYLLRSLPHFSGQCKLLKQTDPDCFVFTVEAFRDPLFAISSHLPFREFCVDYYGGRRGCKFFNSITEAIQSVKTQLRDVLELQSILGELVANKESVSCNRIEISSDGYSARVEHEYRHRDHNRAIDFAVGAIWLYPSGSKYHPVEKGEICALLNSYYFSDDSSEYKGTVSSFGFDSIKDMIAWFRENVDDLCDPEKFDAACMRDES